MSGLCGWQINGRWAGQCETSWIPNPHPCRQEAAISYLWVDQVWALVAGLFPPPPTGKLYSREHLVWPRLQIDCFCFFSSPWIPANVQEGDAETAPAPFPDLGGLKVNGAIVSGRTSSSEERRQARFGEGRGIDGFLSSRYDGPKSLERK